MQQEIRKLPWWTSLVVLLIFHIGTHVSLLTQHDVGISDYFLPTALGVILINWIGPRYVLLPLYVNAVASSFLWGHPPDTWKLWFFYGLPETIFVALSWLLFTVATRGKYWLPNTKHLVRFLVAGILIPAVVEAFLLQGILAFTGAISASNYWEYVLNNVLGEFVSTFTLTLPTLHYLSGKATALLGTKPKELDNQFSFLPRAAIVELCLGLGLILLLAFYVEFRTFWYLYGVFALYVAIRFGFGAAMLANLYITTLVYVLPSAWEGFGVNTIDNLYDVNVTFLGATLLFTFAAVTGRMIKDVRIAEVRLLKQKQELDKTNRELDQFVYSVSHDLSAPLKTVRGLVQVDRLTDDPVQHRSHLDKIERTVLKLENVITEILDYFQNLRREFHPERINLRDLCNEVWSGLRFSHSSSEVSLHYSLAEESVLQDRLRLKIVLKNLLSNALKYQKKLAGHKPEIRVSSRRDADWIEIRIEDNGEGIRPEQLPKVFDMFYRGHEYSEGAGLGLYIAREAVKRIDGNIDVNSHYGSGSSFYIRFKPRPIA